MRDPSGPTVRLASEADRPLVTTIVTLAFTNDPLWGWVLARPDGQTDHLAPFWSLFLEGAFRYPNTWVAGDGEATSVWIPPGCTEMTADQEELLGLYVADHLGPKADVFFELLHRFEAAHPREVDHYYLSLLGTHPDHRGHGTGMALLAHDLKLIDAEHAPAYLESSNPANNDRYASVGFEKIGEFAHPGDGPPVTTMWRPAR
jgi:GNAT superfamily N-acetyltransferase